MATRNLVKTDRVYVASDLYCAGYTEDGSKRYAECYKIVIQREDGHRISLNSKEWYTITRNVSEEGFVYFTDEREKCRFAAEKLVASIEKKGVINLDYWTEIEPAYGSDWYCKTFNF